MNSADERGNPHLWGHVQEAAQTAAAADLERPDLSAGAEASAEALFASVIDAAFPAPHVQAYDVQAAICVMDALATATARRAELVRDLAGLGSSAVIPPAG